MENNSNSCESRKRTNNVATSDKTRVVEELCPIHTNTLMLFDVI